MLIFHLSIANGLYSRGFAQINLLLLCTTGHYIGDDTGTIHVMSPDVTSPVTTAAFIEITHFKPLKSYSIAILVIS